MKERKYPIILPTLKKAKKKHPSQSTEIALIISLLFNALFIYLLCQHFIEWLIKTLRGCL